MNKIIISIVIVLSCSIITIADEEDANRTYIQTNSDGVYYAKSIPEKGSRVSGKTKVYQVNPESDLLIETYDFYSPKIYLDRTNIAAFGPWARGHKPNSIDPALAFYAGGKLIKAYSNEQIYNISNKFEASMSHYKVFKSINGVVNLYRKDGKNTLTCDPSVVLSVTLFDEKEILFNFQDGEIIKPFNGLVIVPIR